MSTGTRYEIRSDHPNPAYASEWAIFAIDANSHRRHVALTTVKAEAEAMLLGLQHGASMLAALEALLAANERAVGEQFLCFDDTDFPGHKAGGPPEWYLKADAAARAAIAKARGGAK